MEQCTKENGIKVKQKAMANFFYQTDSSTKGNGKTETHMVGELSAYLTKIEMDLTYLRVSLKKGNCIYWESFLQKRPLTKENT
jgi:hypothetical protein